MSSIETTSNYINIINSNYKLAILESNSIGGNQIEIITIRGLYESVDAVRNSGDVSSRDGFKLNINITNQTLSTKADAIRSMKTAP